jgi:hypothetical protein
MLQSLDAFRPNHVAQGDFVAERKMQLRRLGVRSERQLQQQALYLWFGRDLDGFKFEPTHSGGTAGDSKGFQPNGSAFTIPLSSTADELGAALRKAFSLCTTIYERPANT